MRTLFNPAARWPGSPAGMALSRRLAPRLDRAALARGLEALLRLHGDPIAYEILGHRMVPDRPGDPDIALVLADAEHDLFVVAQRERGAMSFVSVREAIHDAATDLLVRAAPSLSGVRRMVAPLILFGPG